jgi:hypothetical protein
MTRKQNEVACIQRLISVGMMVEEWMDFLLENKLIETEDIPTFRLEKDKALYIHEIITKAKKDERVLLFDFEWNILPVERIRVTVVTSRNNKEFVYNGK